MHSKPQEEPQQEPQESSKPPVKARQLSMVKVVLSTLAAAFGVQSRKNLEDDFDQNNPFPFIIAGLVFTALFVIILSVLVRVLLTHLS